jgi:predicted transcriptional regulator
MNTASDQNSITIKTFITILEAAAKLEISAPVNLKEDTSSRLLKSLQDEGLLDIQTQDAIFAGGYVHITPKGALALSQWKNELKKETIAYRIGENLLKFLWLLAGALIASTSQIIAAIST